MATYEKPTTIPRWNDDETNNTEPSEGKKDVGWEVDEVPPSSWENWRTNLVGKWFKWLDERIVDTNSGDGWNILNPATGDVAWGLDNSGVNPYLWTEIEDFAFFGSGTEPKITFQTALFPGHEAWISYNRPGDWFTFHAYDEDVLILTVDSARFRAGHTLYPATTSTGNLGNASHYWAGAYVDRIYESSPLVWHGYLSADVVLVNAVEDVITPGATIALNDIAVATGQISFAENGLFHISCDFAVKTNGTSGDLLIQAYKTGVAVTNTLQHSYFDSTNFKVVHYETVVSISDHTTQYVEIRGLVASSGLNTMTVVGGSGSDANSHMTITAIYLAP